MEGQELGTHQRSYGQQAYYSPPPPPLALDWRFAIFTQKCDRYQAYLRTSNLGDTVQSQGPSRQKPVKIQEKRQRGRIWGLPTFFGYQIPILSQDWVKLRTSNFVRTFIGSIGTKGHKKFWKKVAVGIVMGLPKFFRAPIYRAHRAVIFTIAQAYPIPMHLFRVSKDVTHSLSRNCRLLFISLALFMLYLCWPIM